MNTPTTLYRSAEATANAWGKTIAGHLTQSAEQIPHEFTERLKVARALAVSQRKMVSTQPVSVPISVFDTALALQFGNSAGGWLPRLVSLLPLLALVAGLVSIGQWQDEKRALEVAEVDAELLLDELPPQAYADPGFAQYLRVQSKH